MCGGGWDWMLCDRVYCGSSAAQVAGNHQHSLRQPEVVAAEFEWNVSVCVPKELQSEKLSLNQGLSCTNTQNVFAIFITVLTHPRRQCPGGHNTVYLGGILT